ncbi:hypothetical protein O6H91_08G118000 [Diphasiastrum complanatum]|uniref:Uncharacterized protein n=1 Tax=Diphasiastrum complanatum TaxID=34168 RepID=A0ACC2D1K4_DIPCM|nr:hypothetical protein O6H91_Y120000 [Diphasiastrum complanatum]KAJ7548112.1 hypothetical protein O6H91_08G118000 [Diphasiastrum complanatum]
MEGGTTRMGSRSSTRHGPAAVFQGPVRRWRKSWTKVSSSSSAAATHAAASRVLLYKWIPIPSSSTGKEEIIEEAPIKPVRYLPLSVLLAKKNEKIEKPAVEGDAADKEEHDTQEATNTMEHLMDEEKESQEATNVDTEEVEVPTLIVDSDKHKMSEESEPARDDNFDPSIMGLSRQDSETAPELKSPHPDHGEAQQDKEG